MEIEPEKILIQDYTYTLPQQKIAAFPLLKRDDSRLLLYRNGEISDQIFHDLAAHIPAGSLLVLNDTRVIEARIFFKKESGAVIEIFLLEPYKLSMEEALQQTNKTVWKCLVGGASKWKHGLVLEKELHVGATTAMLQAKYVGKEEDSFIIEFQWLPETIAFADVLHVAGAIPLPPYIKRNADEVDKDRYQTIFSLHEGSVAAPTAALHFTNDVFEQLEKKQVEKTFLTLHVGAGTFKPVKTETIAGHQMHYETFTVSLASLKKILENKKIIAVGTTSVRTLESLHWLALKQMQAGDKPEWQLDQWECYELDQTISSRESYQYLVDWMAAHNIEHLHCRTSLIIVPGYKFKVAEALITNFHQPQSTLLLLVAAFVGEDWKRIYEHALQNNYRFLSYGDSNLLWRNQ